MSNKFVGANVKNVTLKKQSDVVIKKMLAVSATVNLPEDKEELEPGQVLVTIDGGETFEVAADDAEANGILCEALMEQGKAEVLVCGIVRKKYLAGFNDAHKEHLFTNKIILR